MFDALRNAYRNWRLRRRTHVVFRKASVMPGDLRRIKDAPDDGQFVLVDTDPPFLVHKLEGMAEI